MARIFTDGAEMGDVLSLTGIYNSNTTTLTVSTTQKRSGEYSYKVSGVAASTHTVLGYVYISDISEIYFRFNFYAEVTTVENYVTFFVGNGNETPIIALKLNNKKICAYVNNVLVATGTHTDIDIKKWNLVEGYFKMADAGAIQTKINGIPDIDYSGDTKPGAGTTFDRGYFGIYNTSYTRALNYIDDIAINDTTGGVDDSWCGDGHIILLQPDANGDSSDLIGSDGDSTNNYLHVDEIPSDSDTSYVQGAVVDDYDLYNVEACGLSDVDILRVWPEARAKETNVGDGQIALMLKTESTEYDSTADNVGTSYQVVKGDEYTVNPNTSAAWTTTQLDALQVGVKIKA